MAAATRYTGRESSFNTSTTRSKASPSNAPRPTSILRRAASIFERHIAPGASDSGLLVARSLGRSKFAATSSRRHREKSRKLAYPSLRTKRVTDAVETSVAALISSRFSRARWGKSSSKYWAITLSVGVSSCKAASRPYRSPDSSAIVAPPCTRVRHHEISWRASPYRCSDEHQTRDHHDDETHQHRKCRATHHRHRRDARGTSHRDDHPGDW